MTDLSVAAPPVLCTGRWVGPTGIVWVCVAEDHPTDLSRGYAGTGHNWRPVHPVR